MDQRIEGIPGFDWDMYADGYSLQEIKENKGKKYSKNDYIKEYKDAYLGKGIPASKELQKNSTVAITDFTYVGNDTILADVNGGVNNVVIDLNKEQKFFNILSFDNETRLDKESFVKNIKNPEFKSKVIELGLTAKIGTDVEKASIWSGYVENLTNEMKEQIHKNNKAYMAKVISSNNGGFIVEVAGTIQAFMPGSMSASNKLIDYESLVGQDMEVMIESYDKKFGFVVSRKKYLSTIKPIRLAELTGKLSVDKDYKLTGSVTGSTQFGIFVELDDVLTGMIHKTLMSDELRNSLRNNEVEPGTLIDVYVHKIEDKRIILSDVPSSMQAEVIARREAEDKQEKANYMNAKKEAAMPQQHVANEIEINTAIEESAAN